MQTEWREALGVAIHQAVHQQNNPGQVMTWQVTTIKGKWIVQQFLNLVGQGRVELTEGITLQVASNVDINMQRDGETLRLKLEPAPKLTAKVAGLIDVNAAINGIDVKRNELQISLKGLPDISIGLE